MSIYEKTNVARALLYWAKNNNGNKAYYLEDRMYAVADGDMVIILTADSYDEAIQKANGERPQGEIATKLQQTQGDCISREALKDIEYINKGNFNTVEGIREWIDNATPVKAFTEEDMAGAYNEGYACGGRESKRPQGDLADEVWKLYEKHHSHLATHVIEFGDELKDLLGKYQRGGAENG